MNKNERWKAGRDNKYFEGEQGKEKKRRGKCPQFRGCIDLRIVRKHSKQLVTYIQVRDHVGH
jgi:hypothetical protein